MPTAYEALRANLKAEPKTWLVTGAAGFIGSSLVETLLTLGQRVTGLDNFATGHRANLEDVLYLVGEPAWARFRFVEGDITDPSACAKACRGADYVLHQAALASVPRSLAEPALFYRTNVLGFVNMLLAARDAGARRLVYASSSAVYGDDNRQPKLEAEIGRALSPYALSKYENELFAELAARCYGVQSIGLRYFNVFGPRQDPNGVYAAVIPKWLDLLLAGREGTIFGDGTSSRDFCFVENVAQANLLAATVSDPAALNQVYNVACGEALSLKDLYYLLRNAVAQRRTDVARLEPRYAPFRAGDIVHSSADVRKVSRLLGYVPTHTSRQGLEVTVAWYANRLEQRKA